MRGLLSQLFPSKPTLTEHNTPSLVGKVFIVTGGNGGIGLELVKILYSKGGTVYIASRSLERIAAEITAVKFDYPDSLGHLKSLRLDLNDLNTVATCASAFLAQESRLDVLWNNAGVTRAPLGSLSAQGHEATMATNCLGPFLLTKLLLPILLQTARASPEGSIRVVFASSGIIDLVAPPGGVSLAHIYAGAHLDSIELNYSASKSGNWFLASELDKRVRKGGVLSIVQSPGTVKTKGWDGVPWWMMAVMSLVMHEAKMGAYTELWCGLSPEVKAADGGKLAIPWGKWHPAPTQHIVDSMKTKEEGGTGVAAEFWDWCEEQTKDYVGVGG